MEQTDYTQPAYWFLLRGDNLLVEKKESGLSIPYGTLPPYGTAEKTIHTLPALDGIPCYATTLERLPEEADPYRTIGLRASYDYLPLAHYQAAGRARQLLHWDCNSQFCPACGVRTRQTTPICKQCPECKQEFYPVINTAIIVLIRREDSVLLVHARNFKGTFHGLVAGFLEIGETLEECVRREVMEETGLTIKNITYFGSQSWPYPSGLMTGFIADYESGDIKLQAEELSTGAFFTKDNLPEIPKKLSIARKMIDWWLTQQNGE